MRYELIPNLHLFTSSQRCLEFIAHKAPKHTLACAIGRHATCAEYMFYVFFIVRYFPMLGHVVVLHLIGPMGCGVHTSERWLIKCANTREMHFLIGVTQGGQIACMRSTINTVSVNKIARI